MSEPRISQSVNQLGPKDDLQFNKWKNQCSLKNNISVLFTAEIHSEVFFLQRKWSEVDDKLRSVAVANSTGSPESITHIKAQWGERYQCALYHSPVEDHIKKHFILHFFSFFPISESSVMDWLSTSLSVQLNRIRLTLLMLKSTRGIGQRLLNTRWMYWAVPSFYVELFSSIRWSGCVFCQSVKLQDSHPSMAANICCTFWQYPFLMSQSEASHSPPAAQIYISYVLWKLAV